MNLIKALVKRDIKKQLSVKLFMIYGLLSVFCVYFFFCSAGYAILLKGKLDYMSIMLAQIIFGAWASLSVFYDMISEDRDYHVLDCILCSGVKKRQVFISKIICFIIISMVCSLIYVIPITIAIFIKTNSIHWVLAMMSYIVPLWVYIMIYAAIGTLISILSRSSKQALICSLAAGLILMPRFFMLLVDGVAGAFHISNQIKNIISMISPGILISNLSDITDTAKVVQGILFYLISIITISIISYKVFTNQDELNY